MKDTEQIDLIRFIEKGTWGKAESNNLKIYKMKRHITFLLFFVSLFSITSLVAQAPSNNSIANATSTGLVVSSIVRQNPVDATTDADEVTFRVTFSANALGISTDDFTLSGSAAADGTIESVSRISASVYDVKVTGITNSSGTINLDIKGVDGTGTNDIVEDNSSIDQQALANTLVTNSVLIGQSFIPAVTGNLHRIVLQTGPGHNYTGGFTLDVLNGDGFGGTVLHSSSLNFPSSPNMTDIEFVLNSPVALTSGNTFTFRLIFPSGSRVAISADLGNPYVNGVIYQPSLLGPADLYFKTFMSTSTTALTNALPSTDETYTIANVATVTTTDANSITGSSANLGGNITSDNGFAITERGIVYSTVDTTPEIGESGVIKDDEGGTGTGTFSEIISSLTGNTTYYYRAYAMNSEGTGYGEVKTFTTLNPIPVLTTANASSIGANSASLGGNITSDNSFAVTERGIVYSITDTTPEIGGPNVIQDDEGGTGIGTFSETISNLSPGTTYFFRAYAINSNGTGYGEVKTFITFQEVPSLTTADAINIGGSTADVSGEIINNGNSAVTEKGIVYSTTNPSPRISDASGTTIIIDSDAGTTIAETLTGLTTTNIHFYRTYATNSQGTGYGPVKRFTLNNALSFDGINESVRISDDASFDFSNGFSIEAWINPNTVSGNPTIFSQYAGSDRAFAMILRPGNVIEFTLSRNGSAEDFYETSSGTPITIGVWQHVAFTYDGNTMRAYINGVDAGTNSVSGTMHDSSEDIELGARTSNLFYNGSMDEVRIWTRALSQTEIQNGMNNRVPNNAQNLAAYYTFNQGVANGNNAGLVSLTDITSNTNNGMLVSFSLFGAISNYVPGANGAGGQTNFAPNTFMATGNWSNTNNWSQGIVPTTVQNATIANGVNVTIDVDDLNINNFTLEPGANITIPTDKEIIVNGVFTTNGSLNLNSDENDSGVLFVRGTTNGTITYNRGGLIANEWSIVIPPVSGQTVQAFAQDANNDIRTNTGVSPTRYAIGYYDDSQPDGSKWQYFDTNVSASEEFVAGQSYALSRNTNGEVSFTGTLAINNVFQTLPADQWSAIGNPFTTYYPANRNSNSSFLSDNMNALDTRFQGVYVWDNTQDKYVAVSEVDASDRSLPPGQGFFVRMAVGQTAINFQEEKRSTKPSTGNTTFARNTNTTPNIVLSISDNTTTVKTAIKYFDTATQGLNPGYDIGNFNGASLDVYTHLLENNDGTNFTIQSLPTNNYENMVIPVGLKANQGTEITFTAETLNLPTGIDTYLEDREHNVFTKLSNIDANYTFSLENDINDIGRFYIHTSSQVLSTKNLSELTGVSIYNKNNTLKISGLESLEVIVKIYSVLGGKVLQTKLVGKNTNEIELPEFSSGVYIVKLLTEEGKLNKKIIID